MIMRRAGIPTSCLPRRSDCTPLNRENPGQAGVLVNRLFTSLLGLDFRGLRLLDVRRVHSHFFRARVLEQDRAIREIFFDQAGAGSGPRNSIGSDWTYGGVGLHIGRPNDDAWPRVMPTHNPDRPAKVKVVTAVHAMANMNATAVL